jgi:hypothetical protein
MVADGLQWFLDNAEKNTIEYLGEKQLNFEFQNLNPTLTSRDIQRPLVFQRYHFR